MDRYEKENTLSTNALDYFLDGILNELNSLPDQDALNKVRKSFRKKIPLHLRAYAASLLILRAAGYTRSKVNNIKPSPDKKLQGAKSINGSNYALKDNEASSVFLSMGRRHKFFANTIVKLVLSNNDFVKEDIGKIRNYVNYSFMDFNTKKVEALIAYLNGKEIGKKSLVANLASKKDMLKDNKH